MNSIFALCFSNHSFRSLDMIFISGTLKLRKIMSLMLPAPDLLPTIGELPRFPIVLQELDSTSFPQPRPLYYSNSPAKANKQYYYRPRQNLFKAVESDNELKLLKAEYMKSSNLGAKILFRSPKQKESEIREIKRKITHNHSKNLIQPDEEIQESIEADKQS